MSSKRIFAVSVAAGALFVAAGIGVGQQPNPTPTPVVLPRPTPAVVPATVPIMPAAAPRPTLDVGANDAALLRATREAARKNPCGECQVMVQAMCVELPQGFLKDAGVMDDTGPGGSVTLTPREMRMLTALFRGAKRDGKIDILSRPQIQVADGQTGYVQVGQDMPVVTGLEATEKDGATVYTARVFNVQLGTTLRLTPRVNADGTILLRAEPSCTTMAASAPQLPVTPAKHSTGKGPTTVLPVGGFCNTETIQTTLSLRDGETAVIGGMIHAAGPGDQKATETVWLLTPHVIRGGECAKPAK